MIRLADVSEFQENVDAFPYLGSGHFCLIVRAHNGNRPDHKWPARRNYVRRFPFVAVGYYQYLVAERSPVDQARDFVACVGPLRPNEFVILDHEEGSGGQIDRAQAWFSVVDAHYGRPSTMYSGESFFDDELGGSSRWHRPRWMAAYRATEPTDPHELWQNTDAEPFPGIGVCDGNIFHGTAAQFAVTFCGHAPAAPAPTTQEDPMITCGLDAAGNFHVFQEMPDHSIDYTWQRKGESNWQGGKPGVAPAGMKPFTPAAAKPKP